MTIITGNGRIINGLDKNSVVRELREAQERRDNYCSIIGASVAGYDAEELECEAGYVGATSGQCIAKLNNITN